MLPVSFCHLLVISWQLNTSIGQWSGQSHVCSTAGKQYNCHAQYCTSCGRALSIFSVLPHIKQSQFRISAQEQGQQEQICCMLLQSAAEGSAASLQSGSEDRADGRSKQQQTPSHARTARAQAARRLSSELQEVLRHAALAILRIADADAVVGLQQYCQRNFSALPQLMHAANDEEAAAGSRVGMERLTSDSSKPGPHGQQFDWLHGVTLQVMHTCWALQWTSVAHSICDAAPSIVQLPHSTVHGTWYLKSLAELQQHILGCAA